MCRQQQVRGVSAATPPVTQAPREENRAATQHTHTATAQHTEKPGSQAPNLPPPRPRQPALSAPHP